VPELNKPACPMNLFSSGMLFLNSSQRSNPTVKVRFPHRLLAFSLVDEGGSAAFPFGRLSRSFLLSIGSKTLSAIVSLSAVEYSKLKYITRTTIIRNTFRVDIGIRIFLSVLPEKGVQVALVTIPIRRDFIVRCMHAEVV